MSNDRLTGDVFPPLEVTCTVCKGEGDSEHGDYCCYMCEGHGRVVTPFGRAVLEFITERIRLDIK